MVQSPLKKTRCLDVEISVVPSLLLSCNPMTSQPFAAQVLSRVSMWPIPLTPLTAALGLLFYYIFVSYFGLACDQGNSFLCLEDGERKGAG